jgi:cytidyltransferase-like protein
MEMINMHEFKTAIVLGRFQHIHIGHERLINIGLSLCDKVLVFVGSAQESGTVRNPYDYNFRVKVISEIYKDEIAVGRVIISPLKDMTNENDLTPKWGRYVLDKSTEVLGQRPEVMIYGKDKNRRKCFSKADMNDITEVFVNRKQIKISATVIRELLKNDNEKEWQKYVNSKIHNYYDDLKAKLLNI